MTKEEFDLVVIDAGTGGVGVAGPCAKTGSWYSSMRVGEKFSAFKILIERGSGKILGAHLIGPGAEEQINIMAVVMGAGMTANQLKGIIFAYPGYASDLASMV